MPSAENQTFSLYQVCQDIQLTIDKRYKYGYWIKAEINKLNHYTRSGHCYPELVEKRSSKIVAQIRSVIWKTDFERIDQKFRQIAGEPLKDDIKILFFAYVDYHPQYGLSLKIRDIDPNYTMGDLMQAKQETLAKLKKANLINRQKQLQLPVLPKRIAIISVETSKGYADLINILDQAKDDHNLGFFRHLFPAILQGDRAVKTITQQLDNIQKVKHHFDLVAIIRGGGGEVGLSCFNDYQLSKKIAEFPLPVFTGIGHSTNQTVAEMVSHYYAITPTKIAEYLISILLDQKRSVIELAAQLHRNTTNFINFYTSKLSESKSKTHHLAKYQLRNQIHYQQKLQKDIHIYSTFRLKSEKQRLTDIPEKIKSSKHQMIVDQKLLIDNNIKMLTRFSKKLIHQQQREMQIVKKNVHHLKPEQVLKRGYSITRFKGKAVTQTKALKKGDSLETQLYDGQVSTTINDIKTNENE